MQRHAILACALAMAVAGPASGEDFDWRAHEGETITFLSSNHPWSNNVLEFKDEFEDLTGMTVKVDTYGEQQMRQRLVTVMNARSDEIDVFMSLPSREGPQFAKAGWYTDLNPYLEAAPASYDAGDLSSALISAGTFDGLLSTIPLNIEGPIMYYRTDIMSECGVDTPQSIADLVTAAKALKACKPDKVAFSSRGLKPAMPYTYSVFFHNMGGHYVVDGKSAFCSEAGLEALEVYGELLRDYGPAGVVNNSYPQITALYRSGEAIMSFGSSNEFGPVMEDGARLNDTKLDLLPPGPGGSHPTVIGWGVAISEFSSKKDPAWLFLQWSTGPEMQARLALRGLAPPRSKVAESPDYKAWLEEVPLRLEWFDTIKRAAQTGTSEIGFPIIANPQSREYIGQAANETMLGEKSAADACAAANVELQRLVDRDG